MSDFPGEEWRKVASHPVYQVSNYGRMKSVFLDYSTGELGERLLVPCYSWQNRQIVTMRSGPKSRKQHFVHRLVIDAFGPQRPSPYHIVAHNDGNPRNNHISNLRWATHAENAQDKIMHGRSLRGERNPKAKLTADDVRAIRAAPERYGMKSELARRYGVNNTLITRIRNGEMWAHVS